MNRMMVPNILRRGLFFFFFRFSFGRKLRLFPGFLHFAWKCAVLFGVYGDRLLWVIAAGAEPPAPATDTRPHSAVTQMGIKP